jgi:hypothetical protein
MLSTTVDAPADALKRGNEPMLTATAVCRRVSSIKVRISINKWGAWLFRSRSRCVILTLLLCSPDDGYPIDLGSMLSISLDGEGRALWWGTELKASRAPHRGQDSFIWKKEGTHGILKIVDARTSSNFGAHRRVRTAGTIREQPGEENSPADPKQS